MNLFFDTSALLKFFHNEIGSENVTKLLISPDNNIYISELAKIEFISSIHRLFREKELTVDVLEEIIKRFERTILKYKIEPIETKIVLESISLLKDFAQKASLRSLDAIQLATFNLFQDEGWAFVTTDNKLATTATNIGLNVINPITSNI